MKTKLTILFTVACLVLAGCAKESGSGAPSPSNNGGGLDAPIPGDGTLPTAPGNDGNPSTPPEGGSVASFVPTSSSNFSGFFYNSVPNNPRNITVNINLARTIDSVVIRYEDDNGGSEAGMGIVHPTNSNVTDSRYNGWVTEGGKRNWKGFFQDRYGAIVLIIDAAFGTGDGGTPEFLGGQIWYQNFNSYWPNNPNQGPLKNCWLISIGPYDCRTFLSGGAINMISSLVPNNKGPNAAMNYQKLGTFGGIRAADAGF